MTDLKQAAQQALDALVQLDGLDTETECVTIDVGDVIAALRTALAMHQVSEFAQQQQQAEPVAMRMPKVGDKVICLEDESLGEVVSLTAGGSPDIVFDDGSRGTYLLREFAELFGYAEQRQQQAEPTCPDCKAAVLYECVACSSNNYPPQQRAEPVAWMDREGDLYKMPEIKNWAPPHTMLYTTPPQRPWVGLTDEEATKIWESTDDKDSWELLKRVEAKLKERNT